MRMASARRVRLTGRRRSLTRRSRSEADPELLRRIGATVRQVVPTADVILYGSRARGDARPDSDYDVLVLVDELDTQALFERIHKLIYKLSLETDSVISLIVENRDVWESPVMRALPLYQNVQREGRRL